MKTKELDWKYRRTVGIPDELAFLKEEMKIAYKRNRLSYLNEDSPKIFLKFGVYSQPSEIETEIETEIDDELCILDDGIDFSDLYY